MERPARRKQRRTTPKGKTEQTVTGPAPESPTRTCVGCRTRRDQSVMMRLVLDPDGETVRLDYLNKLPGRGAYVCPDPACLELAVKRGGLKRSFRGPVKASVDGLSHDAYEAARRQIRALISLATRAGQTAAGNSRVENCLRQGDGILLLLAHDASTGVKQKFRQWAQRVGLSVKATLTKDDLGAAVGLPETSLVVIIDPGFAQKIEQEVHRAGLLAPVTGGSAPDA